MIVLATCAGFALASTAAAQGIEHELLARARVFPEIGPGVREIQRDAAGRYLILTAPAPALWIYNAAGKRMGQIPAASATPAPAAAKSPAAKGPGLVYGEDFSVDSSGRVYVADRGAAAIKIYLADGTLEAAIPFPSPNAVVALTEGEFAVASVNSTRLVTVFGPGNGSAGGPFKVVREFGDPTEIAERRELNRFLNIGRLAADRAGNIYYAFNYLPEPTVRKYDRYGYAQLEIALATLEFQPVAQAARREIARQERSGPPQLKPIITAIGVDAATQEIWVALGGLLLHFDREGTRRGTYRTYTPEGARLEATSILVEPDRLLLAADPLGIYEFPRPEKKLPAPAR